MLLALGPCATVGLELLSTICEGVRAYVSYRVRLEMTLVTEYKIYTSMNTFSQSVTFAPFVKGMPAFLQVLYSSIFDSDYSGYHVIFITDLRNLITLVLEKDLGNSK